MRLVRSVRVMSELGGGWRRLGRRVSLVPTMGYLHEGHVELMRRGRREVGGGGMVVVSIYVNPVQFGPEEDLGRYPRDLRRDKGLCVEEGVDVVFAPSDEEMYVGEKGAEHSTFVTEEVLARGLEGASRPGHFRGVTTVVLKLMNLVQPEVAVFGAKDWQQAAVVKRMVRDLNVAARVVVVPTRRERDGLAMSSRNVYLSEAERSQAVVLWESIRAARRAVRLSGGGVRASWLRRELVGMIEARPAARVDYVEFFDGETMRPLEVVRRGAHLAMAVYVGKTRLIDNGRM
jgi:pantoate--beta-alanine ligase